VPLGTLINNAELLQNAVQIVLVAAPGEKAAEEMTKTVFQACMPNRVFLRARPETDLPALHPARGKGQMDGRPTLYVCRGTVCSPPIISPDGAHEALAR
jgi:uncharacterized protein YyaL (SSP411 family)